MDATALELLRLHCAWGADEALDLRPRDRFAAAPAPSVPPAAPLPRAAPPPRPPSDSVAAAMQAAEAATSLDALRHAVAGFDVCPLQQTAINAVFADGNPAATLMIIGDTPGEDEDRSGRPFSGKGGDLLDRMLASIGLDRGGVLLTTAVPWRPPGNRAPTTHERAACLPFVLRHVALVRPRRILVLGIAAAASLLGEPATTVRRRRGQWHQLPIKGLPETVALLPSFGLEHLVANPAAKCHAWADLLTLRLALNEDA